MSRALHGARSTDAPQATAVHDHRLRDRPTSDEGGRGGRRALALSPPAPLLERDLDRLRPGLAGEPGGIRLRHLRHPREPHTSTSSAIRHPRASQCSPLL